MNIFLFTLRVRDCLLKAENTNSYSVQVTQCQHVLALHYFRTKNENQE